MVFLWFLMVFARTIIALLGVVRWAGVWYAEQRVAALRTGRFSGSFIVYLIIFVFIVTETSEIYTE